MSHLSQKQKIALILLLVRLKERNDARKPIVSRKWWVNPINLLKKQQGHHQNLIREMALQDREQYRNFLRLHTDDFYHIAEKVRPYIQRMDTQFREAISVEERVEITLRYLATGNCYKTLATDHRISTASVSLLIPEVCDAIFKSMARDEMSVPKSKERWMGVMRGFQTKWNFPCCIGAIDGKHVKMVKPARSGAHYRNYKGTFSIILMAICDADYRFLYVDVGANGAAGDASVWRRSEFQQAVVEGDLDFPDNQHYCDDKYKFPPVLVGDEAFPLTEYMMRPYPRSVLDRQKRIFNYRLSRARRVIENTFGILTMKWRVLENAIPLSVKNTRKCVLAMCVLHNFLRRNRSVTPALLDREDIARGEVALGNWRDGIQEMVPIQRVSSNSASVRAKSIRDSFCEYFNNEGKVSWQDNMITDMD